MANYREPNSHSMLFGLFPNLLPSQAVISDPLDILWHYSIGYMPDFIDGKSGEVGWVRWPHRGVQFLDKFKIPRKQRPYVLSDKFEFRINESFEEVVTECADVSRHAIAVGAQQTWITPELKNGFIELHRKGFAHSYEAWQDSRLVGGTFGIQLGGLIAMISLFHRVSNASKFAAGQAMMQLKDRGFAAIDIGMVPKHHVDFGSEWVARWKYESMLPGIVNQKISVSQNIPCQPVPLCIKTGMPIIRTVRGIRRRFTGAA